MMKCGLELIIFVQYKNDEENTSRKNRKQGNNIYYVTSYYALVHLPRGFPVDQILICFRTKSHKFGQFDEKFIPPIRDVRFLVRN